MNITLPCRVWIVAVMLLLGCLPRAWAGDWPQHRFDASRGASSPDDLPDGLSLRWERHLPPPRPAWPESQPWLRFDVSYSPVAVGKLLFVPSMVSDSVTAHDTETGEVRWSFYAEGPVRFAPIVHGGKVYFGSDDGHLYCVDAARGTLLWKFRAGPSDRRVLGNERLISTWPIRTGPVLLDGTVYLTAGIWPFMGIFIHAIDAETGTPQWTNSGYGTTYTVQPHGSPAFASLVPRGHLAATEHGLVVPGGRTEPGSFDRRTGEFRGFNFGGKGGGSHHVTARDGWYFFSGSMRQIVDGKTVAETGASIHDREALYTLAGKQISAVTLESEGEPTKQASRARLRPLWKATLPESPGRLFLKAGSRFYAGAEGEVTAIEVDQRNDTAKIVWRGALEGTPWAMLAADDKLFVVTREGRLLCFAPGDRPRKTVWAEKPAAEKPKAVAVLEATGVREGYAVVLGLDDIETVESIVRASKLHVIVVDSDAKKVDALRRRMDAAGLYGTRVAACTADATTFAMPPYLADLIVVGGKHVEPVTEDAAYAQHVFRWLRPYGGVAYLKTDEKKLRATVQEASLAGAQVRSAGDGAVLLVREGPLPGAADWTHQYADAANSGISQDDRVKTPLGLLWFGGPPNDEVLPRHGHGPAPQVAGGRLFIEGRNMLRALDIYTGRLLWQRDLPNLGRFHDNTGHQPGAGEIGGNCASTEDSVYVVFGEVILRLDAATGKTMAQFDVDSAVKDERSHWGYVGVWKDRLIATATPVVPGESSGGNESSIAAALKPAPYSSASRRLVVMDRRTGKVAWQREAEYGFRHNNIAVGRDTVFCIDALSRAKQDTLKRRGIDLDGYRPRLVALDVATGKERWSTTEDVFGTFLNYSAEHDVLLQAGSAYRDRASDETKTGMAAYRGADGRVLWKELDRSYSGPCLLHGDSIIAQGPAYSLLTGKPKTRAHPLTGETLPWQFTRNYGCNTAIGSRHLLTFRSAAAGFYDLAGDGGTGNLGGFKSGCTSNLIVAGGLLNAPEYTRTCTCRYQNQTSLALIHDPEVEMWTFNALEWDGQPVQRAGINFGAPGDRRAADGTLWMDFPSRGGPSPDLPVELDGEKVEMFRRHSSAVQATGDGFDWVAASGVRGARRIAVTLTKRPVSKPLRYTVRLHFAEVDDRKPGQRVFAVRLQDKEVIASLDIAKEAGPGTALVKEFKGIEVTDKLTVALIPGRDDGSAEPVLCGLEIIAEK